MTILRIEQHSADVDYADRVTTYRWFVRGVFLFAAHTIVILALLAIIFL